MLTFQNTTELHMDGDNQRIESHHSLDNRLRKGEEDTRQRNTKRFRTLSVTHLLTLLRGEIQDWPSRFHQQVRNM